MNKKNIEFDISDHQIKEIYDDVIDRFNEIKLKKIISTYLSKQSLTDLGFFYDVKNIIIKIIFKNRKFRSAGKGEDSLAIRLIAKEFEKRYVAETKDDKCDDIIKYYLEFVENARQHIHSSCFTCEWTDYYNTPDDEGFSHYNAPLIMSNPEVITKLMHNELEKYSNKYFKHNPPLNFDFKVVS